MQTNFSRVLIFRFVVQFTSAWTCPNLIWPCHAAHINLCSSGLAWVTEKHCPEWKISSMLLLAKLQILFCNGILGFIIFNWKHCIIRRARHSLMWICLFRFHILIQTCYKVNYLNTLTRTHQYLLFCFSPWLLPPTKYLCMPFLMLSYGGFDSFHSALTLLIIIACSRIFSALRHIFFPRIVELHFEISKREIFFAVSTFLSGIAIPHELLRSFLSVTLIC